MAKEKRRLIAEIQNRRAQVISILSLKLLNAFLVNRLGYIETALDSSSAKYSALSAEDKKEINMLLQSATKDVRKALENLQSAHTTKAFFGITANQTFRYMFYGILFAPTLWAGHEMSKSLYNGLVSPFIPLKGKLQDLEKINQRESNISQSVPFIFAFLVMLEFLGVLKMPNIIFHLLLGLSVFGWLERQLSGIKQSEFVYIESTTVDTPSVFFKIRRQFLENDENKNIVDLILKGETSGQGRNGFFFKNPLEKNYDLKVRADKNAYFKKEVAADGEITYDHLESKPKPAPK